MQHRLEPSLEEELHDRIARGLGVALEELHEERDAHLGRLGITHLLEVHCQLGQRNEARLGNSSVLVNILVIHDGEERARRLDENRLQRIGDAPLSRRIGGQEVDGRGEELGERMLHANAPHRVLLRLDHLLSKGELCQACLGGARHVFFGRAHARGESGKLLGDLLGRSKDRHR